MDAGIIKILEFLSEGDTPVGKNKDISLIMNELFPLKDMVFDKHNLERFFADLGKYTTYDKTIPYTRTIASYGFSKLSIASTNDGFIALKKEHDRIKQAEVYQSAIDVNNSIKDTNELVKQAHKSLMETNRSVRHTNNSIMASNDASRITNELIASSSSAMARNSNVQTDILNGQAEILKRQTWIFFATAVFALVAAIIAGVSLGVEIRKDQSGKQLQQQTKEIKELRIRIKTLMTDTSVGSAAKKNLPEKK